MSWLLAPLQQDHRGTYPPDAPAPPLLQRIFQQGIVVFVVPCHEGRGEGPTLQPVQALVILSIAVPNTAEVTCQVFYVDGCKITVRYSGEKNPAAVKNIKDTLISSGTMRKS